MKGFVLAAGFGTRLRPITDHLPKALVPVCGKPLLSQQLSFLKNHGITSIGVNTHYLHEQLERFRQNSGLSFELFHEKDAIRGTGGALYFAREFLAGDESFCVMNVDIVCRIDLQSAVAAFTTSSCSCALLAFPAAPGKGTVVYNPETGAYLGTSSGADEKGVASANFIGIALYKKEFLSLLTPDDFSIVPVWSRACELGLTVQVVLLSDGYWKDIGTPRALAQVHFAALDGEISFPLPPQLVINTEKKICAPQSLFDTLSSTRNPYAWVESELVAPGTRISRSVVFEHARIDGASELTDVLVTRWGIVPVS